MPCDYRKYPPNWFEIRARILERAGDKCEWCKAPNRRLVLRGGGQFEGTYMLANGETFTDKGEELGRIRGSEYDSKSACVIILTIAHLGTPRRDGTPGDKHDKMDCRDENLAALCQKCHLNYDRADHIANRKRNRELRSGQDDLIEGVI